MDKIKIENCLCEFCVNIRFLLRALEKTRKSRKLTHELPNDELYNINVTVCPKLAEDEFHKRECINRSWESCGINNVDKVWQDLVTSVEANSAECTFTWQKWVNAFVTPKGTIVSDSENQNFKRKVLQAYDSTIDEIITELKTQLKTFALHVFFIMHLKW